MYLAILFSVMALELFIVIGLMCFSDLLGQAQIGIYASPAIMSIGGGIFYWKMTENRDKRKM